ncbi:mitochondrial inner membrane protein Mpv17-like [Glandiceps talaboti]
MLGKVWARYLNYVARHPMKSQAYSAGVLFCVGDVVAQQLVERRGRNHNIYRTIRTSAFGLFIGGPTLRGWYVLLDKIYKGSRPQIGALQKMCTDQIIMAPLFIFTFFTTMSFASGMTTSQVKEKLKQDYFDALKTNYKVWPLVQLTNFYLVPLNHRVLFVNVVALFWNTYMAWKANTSTEPQTE